MSGNGISCAVCKSAPRSRQTTTPAPNLCFYRPCPSCRPTNSVKALKACCLLQERGNHKRHLEPLWDIGVVTMGNKNTKHFSTNALISYTLLCWGEYIATQTHKDLLHWCYHELHKQWRNYCSRFRQYDAAHKGKSNLCLIAENVIFPDILR